MAIAETVFLPDPSETGHRADSRLLAAVTAVFVQMQVAPERSGATLELLEGDND